jgi:hypothetical protein
MVRDMMPKATIKVPNVISANVGSSFLLRTVCEVGLPEAPFHVTEYNSSVAAFKEGACFVLQLLPISEKGAKLQDADANADKSGRGPVHAPGQGRQPGLQR